MREALQLPPAGPAQVDAILASLYVQLKPDLLTGGALILRSGNEAVAPEDLVQDTFVRLLRHRDSIDPDQSVSGLARLAHRQIAIDEWRYRQKRPVTYDSDSEGAGLDPPDINVDVGERVETRLRLAAVVDWLTGLALPKEQLEARFLSWLGHTYTEIAHHQGVPLSTVKGRIRLANQAIRAEQAEQAYEDGSEQFQEAA